MKEKTIIIVTIILVVIAVIIIRSLPFEEAENKKLIDTEISFETLLKESNTKIEKEKYLIVNKTEDWADLWTTMFPTQQIASAINFSETTLIGTFQGQQPTGGYSIEIKKIKENEDEIKVYITKYIPGENCALIQAITSPAHIVSIKKPENNKKFRFITVAENIQC